MSARESEDILTLVNLLRSGLVRNLGNITSTKLFTHAYAGTKLLIDDYITQVALSIQYVASVQPAPIHPGGFTSQAKLELLHDTRQAFGRTTLLLQGGSAFGLCHLGVVKALHLQGLLPRIITGTAAGAMIAALVGIHSEDELLPLLDGAGIDLSAFERRKKALGGDSSVNGQSWFGTFYRRMKRLVQKGYLFDVGVLEECVRANVGDLTFEEAYARSKRILNITVATTGKNGTPNLLNYLTAPNVVCLMVCSSGSNDMLTFTAHLVCCCSLQRFFVNSALLASHNLLQRRNRHNHTLATYSRCNISTLATCPLQRRGITPVPNLRALQRQPLHRLPSTTIPSPIPPLGTQPPRPTPNRLEQPLPLINAPNNRRAPSPTPPTRLPRHPPSRCEQTLNRRNNSRTKPDSRPRSMFLGSEKVIPKSYA